jgi:hypothetical protein
MVPRVWLFQERLLYLIEVARGRVPYIPETGHIQARKSRRTHKKEEVNHVIT